MDVLSSRILLRPGDLDCSRRFYRDMLGLAICREFGPPGDPGVVFFPGQGLPGVSGHADGPAGRSVMIWMQVRDVRAGHARLAAAGVPVIREPAAGPWGLTRIALITGGSRGLGRASARALADDGTDIIVTVSGSAGWITAQRTGASGGQSL